uniref:Uncharacterized protein n=1 Tax=Anopheles darlingi TaxID=43151 RepID=A0A2M4DHJ6_ANODA
MSVSFQTGFSEARIVFVFFFTLSASGMSLILTYGSLEPFGSIGIRLRPCFTSMLSLPPIWVMVSWMRPRRSV